MGALPKHKPSTRRQGRRRATHKIKLINPVTCPHCSQPKVAHLICPNCKK